MIKCYVLLVSLILILIFFSNFALFLYEINHDQTIYNFDHPQVQETKIEVEKSSLKKIEPPEVVKKEALPDCVGSGWELIDDFKCQRKSFYHRTVDEDLISSNHDPCNNFYNHACKHYTQGEDVFQYLISTYDTRLREITLDIVSSSHMDTSILTKFNKACRQHYAGHQQTTVGGSASEMLKMIDRDLRSHSDIAKVWGRLQLGNIPLPVVMWVDVNPLDGSEELIPVLGATRVLDSAWDDVVGWLRLRVFGHLENLIEDHVSAIDNLLRNELRNIHRGTNIVDYITLFGGAADILYTDKEKIFGKFDIHSFISSACPKRDDECPHWIDTIMRSPWWLAEKPYFQKLQAHLYRFPLEAWKSYTKFAVLTRFFAAENTTIASSGIFNSQIPLVTAESERVDCADITRRYLDETIESYYRNRYITKKVVHIVEEVFSNLKETYISLVDDDRRQKLQRMKVVIDASPQLHGASIFKVGDSHLENVFEIESVKATEKYSRSNHYHGHPLAYYQYETNTVHLGMGLLQQPLFSITFDPISLYSRLGVVLAHEMTHAFDAIGVYYDAARKFDQQLDIQTHMQEKFNCFIDLYSIEISDNHNTYFYDGVSTMNENVADIIGLDVSFKTYLKLFENKKEDIISFFLSYAQLYCNSVSNERQIERQRALHFSHSISSLRVNIPVFSQDSFNQIFDCTQKKVDFNFFNCTFLK